MWLIVRWVVFLFLNSLASYSQSEASDNKCTGLFFGECNENPIESEQTPNSKPIVLSSREEASPIFQANEYWIFDSSQAMVEVTLRGWLMIGEHQYVFIEDAAQQWVILQQTQKEAGERTLVFHGKKSGQYEFQINNEKLMLEINQAFHSLF